jgi:hypothetical protein
MKTGVLDACAFSKAREEGIGFFLHEKPDDAFCGKADKFNQSKFNWNNSIK